MNIDNYIKRVKNYLEVEGYDVAYIGLYGSQNYSLHDSTSDIDLRVLVYPSLEDLIKKRDVSTRIPFYYGDLDVKDLMTYTKIIKKGNFSFIEPFQSQWYLGDERLRDIFSEIPVNLFAIKGAMLQKLEAFYKNLDPKNISHAIRLDRMLYYYSINELPLTKSFKYYTHDSIDWTLHMDLKRGRPLIYHLYKNSNPKQVISAFKHNAEQCIPKDYVYYPIKGLENSIMELIKEHLKQKIIK